MLVLWMMRHWNWVLKDRNNGELNRLGNKKTPSGSAIILLVLEAAQEIFIGLEKP